MYYYFGNLPVPNFEYACPALQVDFSSWLSLQVSFCKFLSFSELTAFTSRSVALAVNSGVTKNCANLYNKPINCINVYHKQRQRYKIEQINVHKVAGKQ